MAIRMDGLFVICNIGVEHQINDVQHNKKRFCVLLIGIFFSIGYLAAIFNLT